MLQRFLIAIFVLILAGCSGSGVDDSDFEKEMAVGWYAKTNEQCVPFARRASGIEIYGDAHTWWYKSDKSKRRKRPKAGAVMVLSKTRRLSRGHLAVVKEIVNKREINVTHTNWGHNHDTRRVVYESMRVKDVSHAGDWSSAIFWNKHTNNFGSPYKVSGFILP